MFLKILFALVFLSFLTACGIHDIPGTPGPQGPSGLNGNEGADATGVTAAPICPDKFGPHGEQESYLSIDGFVYVVTFSGNRTTLVRLAEGNYLTTDGANCPYSVTADGQVVRQ